MDKRRIIVPLPSYGFDPTEAAIPWKILSKKNIDILFATPGGQKASADIRMLTGEKLGIWKSFLMARKDAVDAYKEMQSCDSFCNPITYDAIKENNFDAIILPGGHDKGVREYLESKALQNIIVDFFKVQKPVAAICHGVVLAARSIDSDTKRSVIYNYTTTALLKSQESAAYNLTRWWLKDYYLTYPAITVEEEVRISLSDKNNFLKGPIPLLRDDLKHLERGFTVKDRNYLSARWPGDAYNFALEFIKMVR